MKNQSTLWALVCIAFTLLSTNALFAQDTLWHLDGNSNVDSSKFIGSTNNADLNFKTHDSLRMQIGKHGGVTILGSLFIDSVYANHTVAVGNGDGDQVNLFGGVGIPIHDLLRASTKLFCIMGGNQSRLPPLTNTVSQPLKALGVNTETPGFMIDAQCGSTTDLDINVGCSTCSTPDAVGYRIGSNMVLWHNGLTSSIFVGVNAGQLGQHNTFVGSGAGQSNPSGLWWNTYVGEQAGNSANGDFNTFVGQVAGQGDVGQANTFMGVSAGQHNNGLANSFLGLGAGQNNNGSWDSFTGYDAGENNTGDSNTFDGHYAGRQSSGHANTFIGNQSGTVNAGSLNTFIGEQTGLNNNTGSFNFFGGYCAGKHNLSGNYNTFTGVDCGY